MHTSFHTSLLHGASLTLRLAYWFTPSSRYAHVGYWFATAIWLHFWQMWWTTQTVHYAQWPHKIKNNHYWVSTHLYLDKIKKTTLTETPIIFCIFLVPDQECFFGPNKVHRSNIPLRPITTSIGTSDNNTAHFSSHYFSINCHSVYNRKFHRFC